MTNLKMKLLKNFYKTTPMREGVLNWYPFDKNASVLESSDGALTPLLRLRCANVESFSDSYGGKKKFDYIVSIDPKEITAASLEQYQSHLNPHGRLLLAFENPFGLRYFAGKRNPRTDLPFTFWAGESKRKVQIRLNQAGLCGQKWYFPMPDHWFARDIYSQGHLPNEFLNMRNPLYAEWDYTNEFDERWMWSEIIRNGAFEFLCNAYLVEARTDENDSECMVDYAAVTAYRERSKALITTLCNDGTVQKQAVFAEGIDHLKRMYANHTELSNLGVKILSVELKEDRLTMKRLDSPTLWDYLVQKLVDKTLEEQELFDLFDQLRAEIIKSSLTGKCFWEMVPANCFYTDNRLIFFDQEYCWEDTDRDIAVIRAIYALIYSPEFQSDFRTNTWIQKLKERYDLTEKWDELSKIADKRTREFVFNVTHTDPLDKAINRVESRAKERIEERKATIAASRIAEQARFNKMCIAAITLKAMNIASLAIYGYGIRGKMLRDVLEINDINIACIVDKENPIVRGIPLFSKVAEIPNNIEIDIVIVTPAKDNKLIVEELRKETCYPVVTLEELIYG